MPDPVNDPERYELICRKVVLIIGGTSGIGRATAIAFTEPPTMFQDSLDLGDGGWIRY
jgi:hypothetical protein